MLSWEQQKELAKLSKHPDVKEAVETFQFEDSSWIEGFRSMNPNYPLDYEVVTRYFELKDREFTPGRPTLDLKEGERVGDAPKYNLKLNESEKALLQDLFNFYTHFRKNEDWDEFMELYEAASGDRFSWFHVYSKKDLIFYLLKITPAFEKWFLAEEKELKQLKKKNNGN